MPPCGAAEVASTREAASTIALASSPVGSQELLVEAGEAGGEGEGGRDVGKEAALARRTMGALTMDARLAYSSVLLESSK